MNTRIDYRSGKDVSLEDLKRIYESSTLGERRPIGSSEILRAMRDHADVLITAWVDDRIVGLARTLTDFSYVAYVADLAVDSDFQHQGIGRELLEQTKRHLKPTCFITLLAAPLANEYYPKLGFVHNPRAWILPAPKPWIDPAPL